MELNISPRQHDALKIRMQERGLRSIHHLIWIMLEETQKKQPNPPPEPLPSDEELNRCIYINEKLLEALQAEAWNRGVDTRTIIQRALALYANTPPPQKKQRPLCDLCGKEIKTPPIILCEKCAPEVEL